MVFAREAAALLWVACIELCQRHPAIAVLDPDATPLVPQDGHYAPSGADRGATPTDATYGPTRRDELMWLEVALAAGKPVSVVLRSSRGPSFDARGKTLADPVQQVFAAWATARELGPFARRMEPAGVDDVFATLRVVAPLLAEQARIGGVRPPDEDREQDEDSDDGDAAAETAMHIDVDAIISEVDVGDAQQRRIRRNAIARVPAGLKVVAMRLFELALHDELADAILAIDPEHPQALMAGEPDSNRVRRAIVAAPGWEEPYLALARAPHARALAPRRPADEESTDTGDIDAPAMIVAGPPRDIVPTASALEIAAGAAVAAVCRPSKLGVLDTAARLLADAGRVDEGLRLLERGLRDRGDDPQAHLAVLDLHARTGREGARLAQAVRSSLQHGCPSDPPWYPDQIQIDLRGSTALLTVGRLDEAIALRANRLDGREQAWPQQSPVLAAWRNDPGFIAWSYAREGAFRGDDARAVEAFGRVEPADAVDLAVFLDALVAIGREDEVLLAWSQFGPKGPVARLAAARALLAAGEWRRGLDELWRVELGEPSRDEHTAIARCGLYLSCAPLDVLETALAERLAIGAPTLAKRMARDVADFTPGAAKSGVVGRALGKSTAIDFDPAWLGGFAADTRSCRAIDALFAELGAVDARARGDLARADRLVNRWLEVVFDDAGEDEPAAIAQAACYLAAHALARYLALATQPPTVHAGALRTVAGEALALVRRHREELADRDARALLVAIDAPLRRADRWIGSAWLGTVERALGLDERCAGDVAAFVPDAATVASRVLGPEEAAMLAWSVARLHRDRPDGWAAACTAQAMRLAMHTGRSGVDEWADAVAAQHAARALDLEDALDQLHTACFLAEGTSAVPCVHAARLLFGAGRAPAAISVLCVGAGAATPAWRAANLMSIEAAWQAGKSDVPFAFDRVAAGMFEALQRGEPARAEKLGRWAVAIDPGNAEAHRNLGLALAQQGKVADAMRELVRGTPDQASQVLAGVLYQAGKLAEAMAVLDYASRWYAHAEQWLNYGGIAYAAMDNPRTVRAYRQAYALEPAAFDASQLSAFAGVLDESGDYAACERIANELVRVAGDDVMWKTSAWNHLARAAIGLGRFDDEVALAERAVAANPLPDHKPSFQATLERARAKQQVTPPALQLPGRAREPAFALLETGEHATAAAQLTDASWRVRRAALAATRYRQASENLVEVTPRARAAAHATLVATVGLTEHDAVIARAIALHVREQAHFARDPVPQLGDRMSRDAFQRELRARGLPIAGEPAPPPPAFVDRVVVPTSRIASVRDYIALLRALATLEPHDALVELGLDDASYLEVSKAWGQVLDGDPELAEMIAIGLRAVT